MSIGILVGYHVGHLWSRTNTILTVSRYSYCANLNGVLAHSQGVPQFDSLVSRSRDNLSVVSREGDAENIVGVSCKLAGSLASKINKSTKKLDQLWLLYARTHAISSKVIPQYCRFHFIES